MEYDLFVLDFNRFACFQTLVRRKSDERGFHPLGIGAQDASRVSCLHRVNERLVLGGEDGFDIPFDILHAMLVSAMNLNMMRPIGELG